MKKLQFFSILLFALCLVWVPKIKAESDVSLYQYSMLFPLAQNSAAEMVGLELSACENDFFDWALFEKIPQLVVIPRSTYDVFRSMRLVGLRFDPQEEEVRLVFQPIVTGGIPKPIADDAALHLFFKMPQHKVQSELRRLEKRFPVTNKKQLGVHPAFSTASEVGRHLEALLCRIANSELYKATYMTLRGNRVQWHFGGFEVQMRSSGQRFLGAEIDILNVSEQFVEPNLGVKVQRMIRAQSRLRASVMPLPNKGDHLAETFEEGRRVFERLGMIAEIQRRADRIENPHLNSPKTVDCVSCHAAESTLHALKNDYQSLRSAEAMPLPWGYGMDASIRAEVMANTVNLRSFGYMDREASISRRVLLESYLFQKNY